MQSRNKAQGAIEYLLIIGAAILVVAIVTGILIVAVNQGQTQTTEGTSKAYDSLHDLAVTGMGYEIQVTLADYSGYSGYTPFPVPNTVNCNNPSTGTRFDCFYGKPIVYVYIDGKLIEQYDLTGVDGTTGQSKSFYINFSGDPKAKHHLIVTYDDCWAGYYYGKGNWNGTITTVSQYLNGVTAGNFPSTIFNPKWDDANRQLPSQNDVNFFGSICDDNHLWDKNIKFLFLKIVRSDGKEVPVTYEVKWSSPIADLDFQ